MKLFTVYKVTNLLNNKIYIGYHITEDINDSYMGSNKHLKNSIKKYGLENFKKETLFIFDNYTDMVQKEVELVNESFVKRVDTYNKNLGGKGGFYYINNNSEFKEKRIKSLKNTLKNTDLKQVISNTLKEYYSNPENKEKVSDFNRRATLTRLNKSEDEKEKIKQKKVSTWKNKGIEEKQQYSKKHSMKLKEYYASEKGKNKRKEISMKVKNSTFRDYIYNDYEKYKYDVIQYVIFSDLLDKDIKIILNLPHSLSLMLNYYQKKGYISNVSENRIKLASHGVIVKKSYALLKEENTSYTYKYYRYLREDYILLFLKYQEYILGDYCDSFIYNSLIFKNFKNVLKYIEYLGLLRIKGEIKIKVPFKGKTKKAVKTIVELNTGFKQEYKLINKENYNEHSIKTNYNGESISISWDRL